MIKIETKFASIVRHRVCFKTNRYSTKTAANLSYRIYAEPSVYTDESTILLLHGLLGSKKHWDGIGKTILNVMKKAVVSVDLRNHGDSPHVNSHKYEDLAADILKLLDKLSIKSASLVGHSMGGRAAMSVALLAPDKIAGLLVVDISPISTAQHFIDFLPKVLMAMKKVEFKKIKKISTAKKEAKKQLESIIKDDVIMNTVLSNIKMKSDHTIGWSCNIDILIKHFKYISSFPESMRRKTFFGPTLFIGGQLSEYLPPDDLSGIREMFPRAVVSYVPQAGHHLHTDDPKTFLEIAIAFLRDKRAGSFFAQRISLAIQRGNAASILGTIPRGHDLYSPSVNAVDLAYKVHGTSAAGVHPIIIIHGLLGSKKNWESMSKKINNAAKRTVIAVDARNHGESPHTNSHTYLDLASDVSHLITQLSIEQAAIIGHSMGGRTGMVLALSEPTKVSRLVVVDISPVSTAGILNNYFPKLLDAMKTVDFQNINNVVTARASAREKLVASGVVDAESMGFILMNIGMKHDKSIGWMCNIDVLKQHFTDIANFPVEMSGKQYSGRTLFIGGDQSNYIPPKDITGIKKLFPNADLKYVKGVGHNVHAEGPAEFLSLVKSFLTS